jgi:hypothetical protein
MRYIETYISLGTLKYAKSSSGAFYICHYAVTYEENLVTRVTDVNVYSHNEILILCCN